MTQLLGELAFTVGERRFRYADVVEAARAWGDWARIEALARQGGDPIDADAFRYARKLLSGDEMRAWLARWHLGVEDWHRWLAREVPREAFVEAVCSGELERLTRKLAERAAVWESSGVAEWDGSGALAWGGSGSAVWEGSGAAAWEGSGPAGCDGVGPAVWVPAMEAHYAAWCEAAVTPSAIERVLSAHRLDWTRVRCVLLRTPDAGVAAEAALCVREDGRDLIAVAGDAGLEPADERLYLSDTPLGPRLTGARVGELVGPVAVGGELVLALVTEREAPSPENPEIRARAREAVAERAVETELLRRVRWASAEALTRCELLRAASFDSVRAEVEERAVPPAPEPEEWGGSAPARRRIRRVPQVWQIDEADCGAAALAMVCRHFGREVSLAHIRRAVCTGADGTSLAGIAHGAEALGLEVRTVKASRDSLDSLPLPAIVHWDAAHWVVLHDVRGGRVRVADPARGHRRMAREEFERRWSGYAALLSPTAAFADAPEEQPRLRWLLGFFAPYRGTLLRAFVLALAAAGLQMAIPVFSQVIVDTVLRERDYALLHVLALAMLAVLAIATLAAVAQRLILSRAAVKIDGTTLDFVTGSLLDLPMSYFAARRTGDIERRLAGLRQVRILIVQNGVQGMTAATQLLVAVALMFAYSPALALVYLGSVPVYALLMRFSRTRLRPIFDSLEEAYGSYQSRQIDAIKGIETVKAMGAEPALRGMMLAQFKDLAGRVFRADLTVMAYDGAVQMTTFLSLAVFLWVGALEVLGGTLSVGQLVSFNALVLLGNAAVGVLLLLWDEVQQGSVLVGRLHDILAEEPEQGSDHSGLAPVPRLEGRVRLERVGFHHGGPIVTPILEDVTLDVPAGATVAIVGRSGSGKTTLVKCLAGLLEPTSGTIRYDGLDMRTLRYRELRRQIGFVLQDTYLFDATIAHNIALDESYPDMERVVWAARVANAHEFVERLPLGYDTRVGETGLLLAGGQRQRIAIARAVYRRPPLLILDEATSSLDSESERAVQENLDRLLDGRTSFVIAHRLSTVRDADVIVVLEKGRIAEQGTHDELMARRGLYWYLVSQQLEL